jgi:hypothetical protein
MFFCIFWVAYLPIVTVILSVVGNWLMHCFRQIGLQAWLASSTGWHATPRPGFLPRYRTPHASER